MVVAKEERKTQRLREELSWVPRGQRGVVSVAGRPGEKGTHDVTFELKAEQKMICLERARLMTQTYQETEGEPIVLRRAKALANILDNMTIYIEPWEVIVGNFTSRPGLMALYPELFWRWLDRLIDNQLKPMLPDEEERAELHEIHKYWKNLAVQGKERYLLPEEVKPYWYFQNHGAFFWLNGSRHGSPNYEKIFKVGLRGIIKEAEDELKKISSDPSFYIDGRKYLEKKYFLEAAIISLEAGCRFGKRYASLAWEKAKEEKDEGRRNELDRIAQACDWVPENPPRTFYEALECYWLIHAIARQIECQVNGDATRFDQVFWPFYKKDKEEGRITREEAQELIEHVWLKHNEEQLLVPPGFAAIAGGGSGGGNAATRLVTIGGVTRDGQDASNELTEIVIDATRLLKLIVPMLAFRYHKGTPMWNISKAMELLREGAGHIAFYNDEFYIPYFLNLGIPLDVARDYGLSGCMRWDLPGKPMGGRILGGTLVLPRCLELALNQGMDKFSGKQAGAKTPDPLTFTSIEDVIQAYLEQVRFFVEKLVTIYNVADVLDEEYTPQPFLSALQDGCIEHGQDCRKYKFFPKTIIQPVGHTTLVNSLAVIKKLVFEEKKVSMAELSEILKSNWEGREELRQMCIDDAPKFGNDDDYVDLLAADVIQRTTQVVGSFKNLYGGHFLEDGTAASTYFAYSGLTGATPDGRRDRDLFNDGTISPAIGTDKKGPTAVLKSVGKVDHLKSFNHLFNQKFMPQYLGKDYEDVFAAYMRTWSDLGIHHIQFNVVDKQTLLDAQEHPEKYPYFTVRVAGYCAYFVDLSKVVQGQIIARTEQSSA